MTVKRKQEVGRFAAKDAQGRNYTLVVIQSFVDAGSFQNPNAELPGLKEIRTADGRHVNRIERGKYLIVESGVDLVSDDPKAE